MLISIAVSHITSALRQSALIAQTCIVVVCSAVAAPGELDVTFGAGGKVRTDFVGGDDEIYSVAVQSDGKIVAAGFSYNGSDCDFAVARYSADGTLDNGFGIGGKMTTDFSNGDDFGTSVVIQSDGKIVLVGYTGSFDFAIVRYKSDGSLDPSFGSSGKVTTSIRPGDYNKRDIANSVALQSDGKILVAGWSQGLENAAFALVRYNVDGSLDPSFGGSGTVTTTISADGGDQANSVAVQSDGKVLVTGSTYLGQFGVVRYNADGSLDTSFGGSGKVTTAFATGSASSMSVAIQGDGSVLLGGIVSSGSNRYFGLVRYHADGTPDPGFGTGGKVTTATGAQAYMTQLAVMSDGKILATGFSMESTRSSLVLARYNPDGTLDTNFGSGGTAVTDLGGNGGMALGMAVQADRRILLGGESAGTPDFLLVRYLGDQPPSIGAPSVTGLGTSSVTLNGTLNPNGLATTAGFQYGLTSSYGSIGSVTLSPSNGSSAQNVDATLTGLTAGSTYHYRLTATNSAGTTNSVDASFTTSGMTIEQPVGTAIGDGDTRTFGTMAIGSPVTLTFSIGNVGTVALTGLGVAMDGADAGALTITANPSATVAPGGSTAVAVRFNPATGGAKTAALHTTSDGFAENPLDIILTGTALSFTSDTDGDGLSDAAEFQMAALGYDWQVAQPALVNTFYANANGAGLYTQSQYDANYVAGQNSVINSPNSHSLYTLSQVQTLNADAPLLTRDASGNFKLTVGVRKSTSLSAPFTAFPFLSGQTTINSEGKIEFQFTAPDNAAFFRVEAH